MDCQQAQQVISDRHTPGLLDQHALDEALGHCETCPDCSAFARAVAAIEAIPHPVAPESAITATMDAIRLEPSPFVEEQIPQMQEIVRPTLEVVRKPILGGPIGWIAAASAATVFVAAVFVTVRLMSAPLGDGSTAKDAETSAVQAPPEAAEQLSTEALPEEETAERGSEDYGDSPNYALAGGSFVSFQNAVYKLAGTRNADEAEAEVVGTLRSSLGSTTVRTRDVAIDPRTPATILVEGDDRSAWSVFTAVTRRFSGVTYVLVPGEARLDDFGIWPELPANIPLPASDDGSPVFREAGTDETGVKVYIRTGSSATQGIAIAPNTPANDPAGGNPNWTWWEPETR